MSPARIASLRSVSAAWLLSLLALSLCPLPLRSGPVEFGRAELTAALDSRGLKDLRIATELGAEAPESFRIEVGRRNSYSIRGGDLRGLMYGLLEAAEQIRTTGKISATQAQAAMPIRGVRVFVHSEAVEREHTKEYWLAFIRMLARNRFNRLNWVFAHQTPYLAPPYPFWVDLPGYPQIRASGLSDEQRRKNLEMLRYVSQTAADHGVEFTLGVWEHNVQPSMQPSVDGLTSENIGPYSYAALKNVLEECPGIRSVQMRTNSESGIPAEQQVSFYRDWVFRAVREAGRLVNLEVRGWLMQPGLLDAAKGAGVPLRLSSKYWAEHIGRPYQPAETWPNYSFLNFLERSMQAAPEPETAPLPMLSLFPKTAGRTRPYDFYWEVWGLGSHRLLLWGDPDFVRRAVHTFTAADTQGFEIDPPLAQRSFGNTEAFGVFAPEQKQRVFWNHDFERYWMFYLLWGRLSYQPDSAEAVWKTELQRRFGAGAADMLEVYRQGSRVINEIVAAHLADPNMYIWPEINPGGLIEAYKDVRPSDWAYVAGFREAVRNRIEGKASAKQTPLDTAAKLHAMANSATSALERARKLIPTTSPEFLSTEVDFEILANLAHYHARKMTAADGLVAFYETGADAGLYAARRQLGAAVAHWKRMVAVSEGVYPTAMSFGPDDKGHWKDKLPYVEHDVKLIEDRIAIYEQHGLFDRGFDFGSPVQPARGGAYRNDPWVLGNTVEPRFELATAESEYSEQTGFGWVTKAERASVAISGSGYLAVRAVAPNPTDLPANALYGDFVKGKGPQVFRVRIGSGSFTALLLKPDGSVVEAKCATENGVADVTFPEGEWEVSGLILKRTDVPRPPIEQQWPDHPPRPAIEHTAPSTVAAGKQLTLSINAPGPRVQGVRLYYRSSNQLQKFRCLTADGARASFIIPGTELTSRWDLQYYFEVLHDGNGGWFYPNPGETTPYFLVRVQ